MGVQAYLTMQVFMTFLTVGMRVWPDVISGSSLAVSTSQEGARSSLEEMSQ